MSVKVSALVWEHGPTKAPDRLMLLALADNADDHGLAWPGMETLAAKCCVGVDAARATIRRLEAAGWIAVVFGGGMRKGHGIPNRYQVNLAMLTTSEELEEQQTGTHGALATVTALPSTPPSTGGSTPASGPKYPPVETGSTPPSTRGEPSVEPSREPSVVREALEPRPEVLALCEQLAERIEQNGSKRPRITKGWLDSCRLLLDRDGRTPEQVGKAIDWCQANDFWRANILSMPTLRKQYDRLRLAALREQGQTPTGPGVALPPPNLSGTWA